MIVSAADLVAYASISRGDTAALDLVIQAAQERVESFLGYEIEADGHELTLSSDGSAELNLGRPILSVESISIDGEAADAADFAICREFLTFKSGEVFPAGNRNVTVTIRAGYENEHLPASLKIAVLRIAAVLLTEGDGAIGVSSVSDAVTGSRSFMERSFNRYLREIASYRVSPW